MSLRKIALFATIVVLPVIAALTLSGSPPAWAATDAGTIAYFRRSTDEVRLIAPDGTNDRLLWTAPTADSLLGVVNLEWRPDGGALAFSSDQETFCSVYNSDVYTILNNGTGLRRVTNSPACAELASYPQGTVTVTVPYLGSAVGVYVQGAPGPHVIYGSGEVTFTNVADLGPGVRQHIVGIWGMYRRLPFPSVDVQAGQTVYASLADTSFWVPDYGTSDVSWRSDGSQIGYGMWNGGGVYRISANPPLTAVGEPLPTAAEALPSLVAWGPASKPDQFLYYSGFGSPEGTEGIYVNSTTATDGGTLLVSPAGMKLQFGHAPYYLDYDAGAVHDLKWLPDGSGFLFTMTYNYLDIYQTDPDPICAGICSDVFEYDFATSTLTQVTRFAAASGTSEDDTARGLSLSPDGQQVAIERVTVTDYGLSASSAIWVMERDGSGLRLLVDNAWSPTWGVTAPLAPMPTDTPAPTQSPTPGQDGPGATVYLPFALSRR